MRNEIDEVDQNESHMSAYDPSRYSALSLSSSSGAPTVVRISLGRSLELQYARLREHIKACTERLKERSLSINHTLRSG